MITPADLRSLQSHVERTRRLHLSAITTRDDAVIAELEKGASYGEVAKRLGVPRATVQSIRRKRG